MFEKLFAAALEVSYPPVPGLPVITDKSTMGEYIGYWFGFLTMLAGVIAFISLIIAGIRYMTSAGNPEATGDAKDRIKGSILGMVLTVSAFLILRTINPVFITPALTPLPGVAGVFYVNGNEEKPAPISEANTANIPQGFNTIKYKCTAQGGGTGPTLLIWLYSKPNFDISSFTQVARLSCGQTVTPNGSFRMAFETPGVYYFLGQGCNGYMSGPVLSDEAKIAPPFAGQIQSIGAVNSNITRFGFVVHKDIDFRGACDGAYVATNAGNNNCFNIGVPAGSISVFNWNSDVRSSGNGVTFYSKPNGWAARNPGDQSGFFELKFDRIEQCMRNGVCGDDPANIDFLPSYEVINAPAEYRQKCPSFKECAGSIKIQGKYLVALYAKRENEPNSYQCQVFRNADVKNLTGQGYASDGRKLFWVNVIPIK